MKDVVYGLLAVTGFIMCIGAVLSPVGAYFGYLGQLRAVGEFPRTRPALPRHAPNHFLYDPEKLPEYRGE